MYHNLGLFANAQSNKNQESNCPCIPCTNGSTGYSWCVVYEQTLFRSTNASDSGNVLGFLKCTSGLVSECTGSTRQSVRFLSSCLPTSSPVCSAWDHPANYKQSPQSNSDWLCCHIGIVRQSECSVFDFQ